MSAPTYMLKLTALPIECPRPRFINTRRVTPAKTRKTSSPLTSTTLEPQTACANCLCAVELSDVLMNSRPRARSQYMTIRSWEILRRALTWPQGTSSEYRVKATATRSRELMEGGLRRCLSPITVASRCGCQEGHVVRYTTVLIFGNTF